MTRELKLLYGHMKFMFHGGLKLTSRRSLVDSDVFVVECADYHGRSVAFSATLKSVEHLNIAVASKVRMSRIATIKNVKQQAS